MFVSLEKKILFFHISKTAGTSITYFLRDICTDYEKSHQDIFVANKDNPDCEHVSRHWKNKYDWNDELFDPTHHINASDAKPFIKLSNIDFSDFFEFVIIRNPYDRFLSQFSYRVTHNPGDDFEVSLKSLEKLFGDTTEMKYWHYPQSAYVNDNITKNLRIYRFEDIDKLWDDLAQYLNLKRDTMNIPFINCNPDKDKYQVVLTLEQKQRIYNMYKSDFIQFGYDREF